MVAFREDMPEDAGKCELMELVTREYWTVVTHNIMRKTPRHECKNKTSVSQLVMFCIWKISNHLVCA